MVAEEEVCRDGELIFQEILLRSANEARQGRYGWVLRRAGLSMNSEDEGGQRIEKHGCTIAVMLALVLVLMFICLAGLTHLPRRAQVNEAILLVEL